MTRQQFIALRRALHLTQREFGQRLKFGSPQPRVSEIERGVVRISRRTEALCRTLVGEQRHATPVA